MLHRGDTPLLRALRPAVAALARAHGHRDAATLYHEERVAELAVSIGALLGLSDDRLGILQLAARVHDIGKLGIPSEIVGKAGKLSAPELALMQTHAAVGYDILLQLQAPLPIADIVFQHHERMDGSGYPQGLKGAAILEEARILAVADVFDALTSYRSYRAALSEEFALGEIHRLAGTALDQSAVAACASFVLGRTATPSIAAIA
jgi:HD-GYP domain-containing protein (c-di-GMP phosphodiesterase class II)